MNYLPLLWWLLVGFASTSAWRGARTGEQVRQAFCDSPEFQRGVQAVLQQGCVQ